jgi:hypothetical protein
MSEIFDERRKALENEYFHRKERETLDKLRAKLAAEAAASGQAAGRQCPLGHGALTEVPHDSVVIDRCENCGGIWLDQGELQQLLNQNQGGGWLDSFKKSFKNE